MKSDMRTCEFAPGRLIKKELVNVSERLRIKVRVSLNLLSFKIICEESDRKSNLSRASVGLYNQTVHGLG